MFFDCISEAEEDLILNNLLIDLDNAISEQFESHRDLVEFIKSLKV